MDYIDAQLIKGLLEFSDIKVQLKGESLIGAMGELSPEVTQLEVLVDEANENKAKLLIEEQRKQSLYSPAWFCKTCHEHNEGSFSICWNCQNEPKD